jgi:MFS family permease
MSRPIGRTIATYGLAAIGGLIGAILLWLATGVVADFLLGLSGMSAREGGRAMVAFFAIGPFGGLLGLGLGVWLVLHRRGAHRNITAFTGAVLAAVALVAAIYGAVIGYYALTDDVLVRNGPPPQLLFELRLPAGTVLPDKLEGVSVDLDTDKNQMFSTLTGTATDDGRPVLQGVVDLYFRTSSRILVLHIKSEPDRLFMLKLPANPPESPDFGPWQRVDSIDDRPGQEPRKAGDGDDYQVRYRVKRGD